MATAKKPGAKYKRILLKFSGEVLQNRERGLTIDAAVLGDMANRLANVSGMGVQTAVVIGGGNIFRGAAGAARGIARNTGDYMGMLATIINALALRSALDQMGVGVRVMSGLDVPKAAEPFVLERALQHLDNGHVVIFAGGTGNPYFSTDTAAALRASEIGANVLLKATKVDGVYTADPAKDPGAERYATLTYRDALTQSLKVMDASAFSLCMENHIPIVVFDFFAAGALEAILCGERIGTWVGGDATALAAADAQPAAAGALAAAG